MMRNFLNIFFCFLVAMGAKSQVIDSIFVAVPQAVMPLLELNSRLDLLDLYNCGMTAQVYNDLGGKACLLEKDSVHFVVQTTASSKLELRVLSNKKDTVMSVVRTVNLPGEHSQILFLDKNWRPLTVDLPKDIEFERCWYPSDSLHADRVETLRMALNLAPFYMHWSSTEDGIPILVYEVSVNGLVEEDQEDARSCLRALRYVWKNGKFDSL